MSDNNNDTTTVNVKESPIPPPKKLSGLRQAAYIMKCLDNGEYFEEIIQKFEGDEQLVKLWMSFLLHNKCIENPIDHTWQITDKGKRWIEKYEEVGGSAAASPTFRNTQNQSQNNNNN
jgi:predicted transcriptional regulator